MPLTSCRAPRVEHRRREVVHEYLSLFVGLQRRPTDPNSTTPVPRHCPVKRDRGAYRADPMPPAVEVIAQRHRLAHVCCTSSIVIRSISLTPTFGTVVLDVLVFRAGRNDGQAAIAQQRSATTVEFDDRALVDRPLVHLSSSGSFRDRQGISQTGCRLSSAGGSSRRR